VRTGLASIDPSHSVQDGAEWKPAGTKPAGSRCYFFTSGQALSESGLKACSPGVVPISL
jgi:hypothetical protein